jgi:hypothetical protein
MTTTSRSTHSHSTQRTSHHRTAKATGAAPKSRITRLDLNNLPKGINPALAKNVRSLNMAGKWLKQGNTTFCNQAFNAYAKKMGYSGFETKNGGVMIANLMHQKMAAPGSGWHKATAQEAIDAAKAGKLAVASYYNPTPRKGRPDGKAPGHVAAVTGEWAPGVPGISQAGSTNFEFGKWQSRSKVPDYFVKD